MVTLGGLRDAVPCRLRDSVRQDSGRWIIQSSSSLAAKAASALALFMYALSSTMTVTPLESLYDNEHKFLYNKTVLTYIAVSHRSLRSFPAKRLGCFGLPSLSVISFEVYTCQSWSMSRYCLYFVEYALAENSDSFQ